MKIGIFKVYNILYKYADCTCSDFVDKNGYGRCRKRDTTFFTDSRSLKVFVPFTCYVKDSAYCSDLKTSTTTTSAGKRKSAIACEGKIRIHFPF